MPIYCTRCDSVRDDSTTPCSCGCPSWSRSSQAKVTQLVEDHLPMVAWVVGKWIVPALTPSVMRGIGIGEIIAAGEERLLALARRFDESFGVQFTTYATAGLRNGLWTFVNREIKRHNREQFYPQYGDDHDPFDPIDKRPDLVLTIDSKDEANAVLPGLLEVLNPRERIAVEMVKAQGYRQREVGEVLGVTRERVRQLAKVGIRKMKEAAMEVKPVP